MVPERRGEGWAEEVFPHAAMRRFARCFRSAAAAAARGTHAPDSAQAYLEKTLRMSRDEAASIVSAAAAWRVTRGGRALVEVCDHALRAASVQRGGGGGGAARAGRASVEDVPDLLRRMPQILAVVPTDEWNAEPTRVRRARARARGAGGSGRLCSRRASRRRRA